MQNLQNLPTETDLDQPMPDDRPMTEEDRLERSDLPQPSDRLRNAPVNDPPYQNDKKPVSEPNNEPPRVMAFYTAAQRRIF